MPDLFGLNVARIVNDSIRDAGDLRPVVITKKTPGTRTPGNLTAGTNPQSESHSARGFLSGLERLRPETIVEDATALVVVLAASVQAGAEPEVGDLVAVDGGTVRRILRVEADPAKAAFRCQVS